LREAADQFGGPACLVRLGAARPALAHGDYLAVQQASVLVQGGQQQRRHPLVCGHTDPVIGGEVAQAVGDQSALVQLQGAGDVGAVADHQVGARVDHAPGETHHVAAGFTVVDLLTVAYVDRILALGTAVKRHQHQVVVSGQPRDQAGGGLLVQQRV